VPKEKVQEYQRIDEKRHPAAAAESAAAAGMGGKIFRVDKIALTIPTLASPRRRTERLRHYSTGRSAAGATPSAIRDSHGGEG
jgi:hypothetical protein